MNLITFTRCLLAVAALGFTTSTACSEDAIKSCEISTVAPSTHDDESVTLNPSCESTRKIVECLERVADRCPPSLKQLINATITGYKQAENIVCEHKERVSEKRIVRKKRWVFFIEDIVKSLEDDFSTVEDTAKDFGDEISGIITNLEQDILTVSKYIELKAVFGKNKVINVFKKTGKNIAKNFGKKLLSCASIGVATCVGSLINLAQNVEITYTSVLCWKLEGAYSCLDSALKECQGEWGGLEIAVKSARSVLGQAFDLTQCKGRAPVKVAQEEIGSCTVEKLSECDGKMVKSPHVNKAHCGSMRSVQTCLLGAQRDCKSKVMRGEIQEYQGILNEYAISCVSGGIINVPSVIFLLSAYAVYAVGKNAL